MTTSFGSPSRETGFRKAAELFKVNNGKLIVETGCYWLEPQGCSTLHLARLAAEVVGELFSFDTNPDHVATSRELVKDYPAQVMVSDSILALSELRNGSIDLLYSDSFDFVKEQPDLLAIHNVAEIGAALPKMSKHSVILMDDWNWGQGEWIKCRFAREFLLHRGWKLIQEDYQLLFAR